MTKAKKNTLPIYFKPVFASLLAAAIVLLTFLSISLRIGPLVITLNCLPVAVGTVFLGPLYGAVLGAVFGLSSFLASFTSASLTTVLLSVSPFYTFLMCVVPRVICGWVPGLLFKALPKNNEAQRLGGSALCCGLTTLLNTAGFLGLMWVFFRDAFVSNTAVIDKVGSQPTGNVFVFIFALASVNAVVEFAINLVFGTAISRAMFAVTKNRF
ncbi:MAG: ECF transporter S component [Ruminococcus sp.]|nr:ECF transporter S component [Ruminococcus sp.]